MRKNRHWLRGIIGGVLLGLGLGLASIIYGITLFGPPTPWVMALIGLVLGILLVFVPAPWGRRRPPPPPARAGA